MIVASSLAGCVVTLLTVWGIAVRQTARVFEPLRTAVVSAQTQHQHWLKFAKEELQKRDKDYRDRYAAIVDHRERSLRKFAAERETEFDTRPDTDVPTRSLSSAARAPDR